MNPHPKPVAPSPAPGTSTQPAEPGRRAWTVNFVLPAPKSMPSDRLKARAELVRNSASCCSY